MCTCNSNPNLYSFTHQRTHAQVYVKALGTLQAAQRNLQAALTGKQNSRCLYTNAVPALGDLNHTLSAAGELVMVRGHGAVLSAAGCGCVT